MTRIVLVAAGIATIMTAGGSPAMAQQPSVVVDGRIVESGTGDRVRGATVDLAGVGQRLSGDAGEFRFIDVPAGRYVIRVEAIGYRSRDVTLTALRDTTIAIELDVLPVALDTLEVRGRAVTVRGEVRAADSGMRLIDVEVAIGANREDTTDPIGRYEIEDVPAGPPLALTVRGFGYLPITRPLSVVGDTTLDFELEADPIVQRMISVQVDKLIERSRPLIVPVMPAITRADLLRSIDWTVGDIIRTRYGSRLDRVRCVLIDDVQTGIGIDRLGPMSPDRIERIEVLFGGRMLRVYTRDYIRRMLSGAIVLRAPRYVDGRPPLCL